MLKKENIICISSIDWDFIWQGHQEIMSSFAGAGNKVLFIENTGARAPGIKDISRIKNRLKNWFSGVRGIRQVRDNLYVFSPLVLPLPYLRPAAWINSRLILRVLEKWFKVMNFSNPVVWVFLPTPLSLILVNNFNCKVVIYYCIDNFKVSSVSAQKIKKSEIKLLKSADLVFVTSKELYAYCRNYNDRVFFSPFAVNFNKFQEARLSDELPPQELADIKKPIIGYIGGVHKWINLSLIKEAALKFNNYSFVFVGPVQTDISLLSGLKNVYFLAKKEHKVIPYFIKNFDVCIIPYLNTDYTKNVYPTKLNEYHAMGKPVVSTDLPEIAYYNSENEKLVFVGKTSEEFIRCISDALLSADNIGLIEQRIAAAERNSWSNRIEEMSCLTEEIIDAKSTVPFNWKSSFLRLSAITRGKFLKASLVLLSLFFLIFYTPLVWFLANPLKISQPPHKADCIVVFAGGAGESGMAGQGYEERVEYAVELYKQGYVKHIIFSSGYTYVFKEPLLMKVLAVSLGVPAEAIILEDKASGTYQNVKFSDEILKANCWNEILLVSSPYHMRRVALVFDKIDKLLKVTYTPINNSLFYAHPKRDENGRIIWKRITLRQISGILHEYAGILYYWTKSYK